MIFYSLGKLLNIEYLKSAGQITRENQVPMLKLSSFNF